MRKVIHREFFFFIETKIERFFAINEKVYQNANAKNKIVIF